MIRRLLLVGLNTSIFEGVADTGYVLVVLLW